MQFDDELTKAIKRRFAPDFLTALRDASAMELYGPRNSVNVPLLADVRVVYDIGLVAFYR